MELLNYPKMKNQLLYNYEEILIIRYIHKKLISMMLFSLEI